MYKLKSISPGRGSNKIKQLFGIKDDPLIPCTEIRLDFAKYKADQIKIDKEMSQRMKKWKQVQHFVQMDLYSQINDEETEMVTEIERPRSYLDSKLE